MPGSVEVDLPVGRGQDVYVGPPRGRLFDPPLVFNVKGKGGYARKKLPWWAFLALGFVAVKAIDRVTRSR